MQQYILSGKTPITLRRLTQWSHWSHWLRGAGLGGVPPLLEQLCQVPTVTPMHTGTLKGKRARSVDLGRESGCLRLLVSPEQHSPHAAAAAAMP
ncbi:hypothetical protein EYF80_032051 [Liparis tanakae]|uniref:Uncharacterized protein n=1 Tax=Liparis tanakae TaxID=230148 RepID=A0A4Z2GYE7_9TELE|nr:hypothetical protein EYF80_032051 [Liparis tanakae]